MGRIEIRQKLRPYSNLAGIEVPFPRLEYVFQIYPTKVLFDRNEKTKLSLDWKFKEPARGITTFFNLLHEKVEVHLSFDKGVLHYELYLGEKGLCLSIVRNTMAGASYKIGDASYKKAPLKKEQLLLPSSKSHEASQELLSFGAHKKQEVERLFERADFREILPILFSLGQMCSETTGPAVGHQKVLHLAKRGLQQKEHDQILPLLKPLLHSALSNLFVPHLSDVFYWNGGEAATQKKSDFVLLREFYTLTRSFLIESKGGELYFLPHLPKELFFGRVLSLQEKNLLIDIEWTKKSIRRMRIKALGDTSLDLHFQKPIQKCRLTVNNKSSVFKNGQCLSFEKSKTYIFDRFEK